jgi:hypothetical protein
MKKKMYVSFCLIKCVCVFFFFLVLFSYWMSYSIGWHSCFMFRRSEVQISIYRLSLFKSLCQPSSQMLQVCHIRPWPLPYPSKFIIYQLTNHSVLYSLRYQQYCKVTGEVVPVHEVKPYKRSRSVAQCWMEVRGQSVKPWPLSVWERMLCSLNSKPSLSHRRLGYFREAKNLLLLPEFVPLVI